MSEEKKQELKEYHKQRYQKTKKSENNDLWLNIASSVKYCDLKDFLKVRFVKKRVHGNNRILRIIVM